MFFVDVFVKIHCFQLKKSVSSKLEVNLSLEQDDMEGVDEKEWNE